MMIFTTNRSRAKLDRTLRLAPHGSLATRCTRRIDGQVFALHRLFSTGRGHTTRPSEDEREMMQAEEHYIPFVERAKIAPEHLRDGTVVTTSFGALYIPIVFPRFKAIASLAEHGEKPR